MTDGPLPQWEQIGGYGSGTYKACDPDGAVWRLWLVEQPHTGDSLPPGYRLAPANGSDAPVHISADHGLYYALDMAGLHIAKSAVQADPQGARRQMGLDPDNEA